MHKIAAALAAALTAALVAGAAAQSTPNPNPRPLIPGQPPGPAPGDVLPAPLPDPAPAPPGPQGAPAPGGPGGTAAAELKPPPPPMTREQQLDALFAALKVAPNEAAAKNVERRISAIWLKSGSDTVDLLTKWADNAIEAKDFALALDYLDRIIALKPDFVEGWDKRANVYFMIEDYGRSLADIERVLAIEPRHFGALAGLGTIMRAIGEEEKALIAYRKALELDPYLDSVRDAIAQLRDYDDLRT
jgi:tetratricopeptide (TPR) repeat protein